MLNTFKMNVIIPPSQNQQSQSEQYQEVVNDLGCYYYEKYILINGKKEGLYQYGCGTFIGKTIEFQNDKKHGKDITYYGFDTKSRIISEIKHWVNGVLHGYYIKYNRHGMPTSVAYYQYGNINLIISFKNDGSIDNENSQFSNNHDISSIINMVFEGVNINECMEKKRIQDLKDKETEYL